MKRLFTLLALLAMFSLTSCEILGGDNITPDNNQTEQPDNGDENKNPDNGDENQDPDNPIQHKIYVYNAIGWEPLYIYMWRWEGEQVTEYVGAWCGAIVEQTEVINGHTYYVYDLPTDANGKEIGVIFNDSNGTQTSDWYITIDKDYYVLLSEATTPSIIEDKNNPTGGNNNDAPVTPPVDEVPETQKIYYTSTDGGIVEPNNEGVDYFGANIISNTYENGKGVITFDGDVTLIGYAAFKNCASLHSITIPNSVTSIGYWALSGCINLRTITLPNSVTEIGPEAFIHCKNLESITIPGSITSFGSSAFTFCTSLKNVTIEKGLTEIGISAFYGCTSLTNITISDSVTTIGMSAFSGCTSLTNINIPNSVTLIGENAFDGCTSLTSINIPDSVTSIKWAAFARCSSLTKVTIGKNVVDIERCVFEDCVIDELIINSKFIEVDNPHNGLDQWYSKAKFKTIVIGGSVTRIGSCTLCEHEPSSYKNPFVQNLIIGDSVTSIGDVAFHRCNTLESVVIGNGVTSIGNNAFRDCRFLKNVTIGNGITSIGDDAFDCCDSLTIIYCKATTPPNIHWTDDWGIISGSFPFNEGMSIYVPKESYDLYSYPSEYEEGDLSWIHYQKYIKPYDFAE